MKVGSHNARITYEEFGAIDHLAGWILVPLEVAALSELLKRVTGG